MAGITIRDFGGRLPRRSKRLLPNNFSQECTNAKLLSGELRGLRAPTPIHTFPGGTNPQRAWRIRDTDGIEQDQWVSSQYAEAELIKCPLIDDAYDRWYLFQPGEPVQVYTFADLVAGTGPWDVAFTQPTTPPTLEQITVRNDSATDGGITVTTTGLPGTAATITVDAATAVTKDMAAYIDIRSEISGVRATERASYTILTTDTVNDIATNIAIAFGSTTDYTATPAANVVTVTLTGGVGTIEATAVGVGDDVPDNTNRDILYVYTYVTEWGEESSPSEPATINITYESEDEYSVEVSGFYVPPPTIEGRAFDKVRIYRSITVGDIGGVFYVGEVDWGVDVFVDNLSDVEASLNEQLPTSNQSTPPPDGIYGARVHPSGAIVAFKDRTVYFSEPYKPHAWPDTQKIAVEDEIVGIETWEQNIGVFTKGRPYMVYGSTPAQVGLLRFPMPEPCIAYGSIVGAPEGAYYASHQGLVLFTAVGPRNITRELISKEEWEVDYLDERMSAARYGTQYVAIERPGSGFILDSLEARIALTDILSLDPLLTTMDEDYYTGDVYAVAGDSVYRWDYWDQEEVDYIWKSKQEVMAQPRNMGAVMVHLEPRTNEYVPPGGLPEPPYPPEYATIDKLNEVLVEVFLNDERLFVGACGNREQVRIPSGTKGDSWEIRVTGQCRLYSVALTETGRGQGQQG